MNSKIAEISDIIIMKRRKKDDTFWDWAWMRELQLGLFIEMPETDLLMKNWGLNLKGLRESNETLEVKIGHWFNGKTHLSIRNDCCSPDYWVLVDDQELTKFGINKWWNSIIQTWYIKNC